MAAWPVLCGRQACHCPFQSSLEQYQLTGTRRDTGHPTVSLLFWPRSEQSHLQEDKKCAAGDRGAWARQEAATQARGWPLPDSAPLSRVAVGAGGLSASSLSTTAGNQCASDQPKIDVNDFGPQLQAAARGSKSTGKRGKHGLGQALPPNYQQNQGGWGSNLGTVRVVLLGLTGKMPGS